MSDYLEAYRKRLHRVGMELLEIGKELTKQGCQVYIPGKTWTFIVIRKNGKHATLGFTDVPYRWYMSYHIDMRLKKGSSRMIKEVHGTENPFSIEQILESLKDDPADGSLEKLWTKHLTLLPDDSKGDVQTI